MEAPIHNIRWDALAVFTLLLAFISWLGFAAARWRRGDLDQLHEWGLGGRRFGTVVTWFLVGGDLYTATTFIAIPALAYGAGALAFFALPYFVIAYPIMFVTLPRLWRVAARRGYVTASDYVQGRFGNRWLTLAVALTGIAATMPYIAMQLVGLRVVIGGLGLHGQGLIGELPLFVAFLILAAFTYSSGLRAPAAIAVVKDLLIYITVLAAVIVIPLKLGGLGKVFAAVPPQKLLLAPPGVGTTGSYTAYTTLALGSALAIFLYPQSLTGLLAASSERAIRRNAALLPAFSLLLPLLVLLGFMAIAAGVDKRPEYAAGFALFKTNFAVPALILHSFPGWFVGVAFAAIGIAALVPAAIMSIASANLFTRNIYRDLLRPGLSAQEESKMARRVSLVVKGGALIFVVLLPVQYAIELQLLAGVWILQTLPAVFIGLYTRWFHGWALLAGWLVGVASGTAMAAAAGFTATYKLVIAGFVLPGYAALYALILNLGVAGAATLVLRSLGVRLPPDESGPEDEDEGEGKGAVHE